MKSVRIRSYSGPFFPIFRLNTERYSISGLIQSECGKIRTLFTQCRAKCRITGSVIILCQLLIKCFSLPAKSKFAISFPETRFSITECTFGKSSWFRGLTGHNIAKKLKLPSTLEHRFKQIVPLALEQSIKERPWECSIWLALELIILNFLLLARDLCVVVTDLENWFLK